MPLKGLPGPPKEVASRATMEDTGADRPLRWDCWPHRPHVSIGLYGHCRLRQTQPSRSTNSPIACQVSSQGMIALRSLSPGKTSGFDSEYRVRARGMSADLTGKGWIL